jgi:hypothetical protein
VHIVAFGSDGDEVVATLLLGQGAPLMAESVTTSMSEPDNRETVEYVRRRLNAITSPPQAQPDLDYGKDHPDDDYQLG